MSIGSLRPSALLPIAVAVVSAVLWVLPHPEMPVGLRGQYYANADWSGTPVDERVDADVSADALRARPELRGATRVSVEWSGYLVVRDAGLHRFATKSDDGSWLWIDDRLVIDNGGLHSTLNVDGEALLERGVHAIRVRYMQGGGEHYLQLGQASARGRFGPIGPLVPYAMSYAEFRAREIWPLALVAFWYVALACVIGAAIQRCRWLPHVKALTDAAGDPTFLIVAALGLAAGAAHIAYGLPAYESLSGDELSPIETLEASRRAFHDWNLRWPPLHLHLVSLALQPFEWARRLFHLPLADAGVHAAMVLVARGLSLAMLGVALLATFDSALELADRLTGYFAVALLASMPVVVYFGPLANLEVPQLCWAALALWSWLKFRRWRDLMSSLVFGAIVGLGLASKDQLYGFYLAAPFAVLHVLAGDVRSRGAWAITALAGDRRFVAVGLATLVGFASGHQLPAEWARFGAHVETMTGEASVPFRVFSHTLGGHTGLLMATGTSFVWAVGVPAACAFVGGCLHLVLSGRLRLLVSLLLPLATYYVAFIAVILYVYDRFLVGFLPIVAIIGGMCLQAVARATRTPRLVRVAVPAVVLASAAASAIGINVVFHTDPRHRSHEWLARNVACGSSVGVTYDDMYVPPLECYDVWRLLPSQTATMTRYPDYFVLNEAYARRFLPTVSGSLFLMRLQSGVLGYHRVFRAEARPPLWAPLYWEPRFWNAREDPETVLDKPLHAIEVWARRP